MQRNGFRAVRNAGRPTRRSGLPFSSFVILFVVSLAISGCLFDPFKGCGKVVSVGWHEPGMYDAFPPPGRLGDYAVRWNNGSITGEVYKHAEDRDLTNDGDLQGKWVRVFDTDLTVWSINRFEALGREETFAVFERTFEEIGLPAPQNPPENLRWRIAAC